MAARESITILHVSDMQFGKNHRFGSSDSYDTLLRRLVDDFGWMKDERVAPELIVVSGDLAEWGTKSECQQALGFVTQLSETLGVPRRQVAIVPGNHDINRSLCEAYFAQCRGEETEAVEPYWPKWKHFVWMFEEFYRGEKDITFTPEEPWSYWEIDELRVAVAALNSTIKESHVEGSHYGWVSERQLSWFAKKLEAAKEKGWLRLGMVHHNVQRGAQDDDENLRDFDDLKRWLAPSVNILLHGHTHNADLGWLKQTVPILATGSAALKREARPEEAPNQYQVIRVWPDRLERWMRRYERKHWIPDTGSSETSEWHTRDSVAFQSVHGTFGAAKAVVERAPREPEREDFASRVAEICRLRNRVADVEIVRLEEPGVDSVRVRIADEQRPRVIPIGVCEGGVSDERVATLQMKVFSQYRALDASLPCEIVYSGERAPDELIAKAWVEGVRLSSFIEFQGIIDFRGYLARQRRKLDTDVVYPPSLYVKQRMEYEIGRERLESRDGCGTILEWLREPLARFVLVLGDFGTGKSFLLHEIARRIPEEIPHLTPMLVELRALEKAGTVEQFVAQHLARAEEKYIDLAAFPYMLREGRIALLFDGFDELATRITYQRAAEHFETLIQAAAGRAKVVVTSRTTHFESDRQVKTALYERTATLPGLHLARLQYFDEPQIEEFLEKLLEDGKAARRRLRLIREIRDLLGLSHNPRMLAFIARLPEEKVIEAQEKAGTITAAELYRMLIERWLTFEYYRAQPPGSAPTLTVQERWDAATAVALCLWPRLERRIGLTELTAEVARAISSLAPETAAHLVGSGTLLVRDEEGTFAFVHQSVMEWLVANHAARRLAARARPEVLGENVMSPLMAEFFRDLAGVERAREWALAELVAEGASGSHAKTNAQLVMQRAGGAMAGVNLAGQDLRAQDFSGRDLDGANFEGADLREARFVNASLGGADFSGANLERADFTRARLCDARLGRANAAGARFLGADLRGSGLEGANLVRAKLTGARLTAFEADAERAFGAALPDDLRLGVQVSASSVSGSVAVSGHGVVASGHGDSTIRLWDAETGLELRVLRGHEANVLSVAFSHDGRLLASTSADGTVRLWAPDSGHELQCLRGHEGHVLSVACCPDGRRLASGGSDTAIRVWETGTARAVRSLAGHKEQVRSVAFSADGRRLASGGDDKTVRLWDVEGGLEIRCLRHESSVTSLAFSPVGQRLAVASYDGTLRLWDTENGVELRCWEGHSDAVKSVAFSPDGRRLASAGSDTTVELWDADSGHWLRSLRGHEEIVFSVAFSPDGRLLASASLDKSVRLWEAESGAAMRSLRGQGAYAVSIAFSHGGLLATASADRRVRQWDAGTGVELRSIGGDTDTGLVSSAAFSPDGRLTAACHGNVVEVLDVGTFARLSVLRGHDASVLGVAFSGDGRRLATASADMTIWLWDPETGVKLRRLRGHEAPVESVAFSSDGWQLASASRDETVRLWNVEAGLELARFRGHSDAVISIAFSPDGRRLASASSDRTVRLWEAGSGVELHTLRGHEASVRSVTFSPDGRRLASASSDRTVRLWEADGGGELRSLRGHEASVRSVTFSPDGRRLASTGLDNTVRIWDVESGDLLVTLVHAVEGWGAFSPDNRYKFGGNLGGVFWFAIKLCRFEPGEVDEFLPPGTVRQLAMDERFF